MAANPNDLVLPRPDTTCREKMFSVHLSKTLDCLGKSQDMIKHRISMYKKREHYINMKQQPAFMFCTHANIAGSKAEGLTGSFESDFDIMFVITDVLCTGSSRAFMDINNQMTIFQTDRQDTAPGYTKLKLVKFEGLLSRHLIENSISPGERGSIFLSSEFFFKSVAPPKHILEDQRFRFQKRSGPSKPSTLARGYQQQDTVHAFCCDCPDILQAFLTRPRAYNRPTRDILRDISAMEAHVVPVGYKGSDEIYHEFRICFTKAEIHLIHSLNDTETKLYILLKLVSKELKQISNVITSYVMKNIVLWMVELTPFERFTEDSLIVCLINALVYLKSCVDTNFIPSYMIPERNLLAGRLGPEQRGDLSSFLATLIHERGQLLMRCEKIQNASIVLYREPDMAEEYRKKRDMAEKLWLLSDHFRHKKELLTDIPNGEMVDLDVRHRKVGSMLLTTVMPEMQALLMQGCGVDNVKSLWMERLKLLLS